MYVPFIKWRYIKTLSRIRSSKSPEANWAAVELSTWAPGHWEKVTALSSHQRHRTLACFNGASKTDFQPYIPVFIIISRLRETAGACHSRCTVDGRYYRNSLWSEITPEVNYHSASWYHFTASWLPEAARCARDRICQEVVSGHLRSGHPRPCKCPGGHPKKNKKQIRFLWCVSGMSGVWSDTYGRPNGSITST